MASAIVSCVGEQPIPNLLPVLFDNPKLVLSVYTDRTAAVH